VNHCERWSKNSATLRIRQSLPNPSHRILAGLKCKFKFPGKEKTASQDLLRATN